MQTSRPRHRLSQIDTETQVGVCEVCGPVQLYRRKAGGWMCAPSQRERSVRYRAANPVRSKLSRKPYLEHRASKCARCGLVPLFEAALSVHHLDHDRTNNAPSNLVTLCLCCHAEVHALHRAMVREAA